MTSYYKTVKTNTFLILNEKGLAMTKKDIVAEYLSRDSSPEHNQDKKLYNNISQALNKFKKQGYIISPARATYQIKEVITDLQTLVDSNKDLVATSFVSHNPQPTTTTVVEETTTTVVEEEATTTEEVLYVEIPDPIIEDPFYMEEETVILPECVYSPLSLEVSLTNGKTLTGTYEVARHENNLLIKSGDRVAIVSMEVEANSEHDAINTFVEKVVEDFHHAPNDVYGAERFCKVLMVCVDAHKHDSPLGGLADDCQDSLCPIHSIWSDKVKIV